MSTLEVRYDGQLVGVLAEARGGVFFEYSEGFLKSGIELSPFTLPLRPGLHTRDNPPTPRLPGLFADSLPDAWGRRVMREHFRKKGIAGTDVSEFRMLAYLGSHGMGALEYHPALELGAKDSGEMELEEIYRASETAQREGPVDLEVLAAVGSSAGGARPKALLGLPDPGKGAVLAGAGTLPNGYSHWLVKFDTSADRCDGPVEAAYSLMAGAAGLEVPAHRLLETGPASSRRRHFAVRRFDRESGRKLHYHSLAGMTQQIGGDLSYETYLRVTRRLIRDEARVMGAFRRAVFNVLAGNRDDHGKNHGFLLIGNRWQLSPAFDLTYVARSTLPERGMSIAGERSAAGVEELRKLTESEGLDRRTSSRVIRDIAEVIRQWRKYADETGVPKQVAAEIGQVLQSKTAGLG